MFKHPPARRGLSGIPQARADLDRSFVGSTKGSFSLYAIEWHSNGRWVNTIFHFGVQIRASSKEFRLGGGDKHVSRGVLRSEGFIHLREIAGHWQHFKVVFFIWTVHRFSYDDGV